MLVNNAGVGSFGKFDCTSISSDIFMINLNITTLHILTKLFLKDMKKRNSGYILNVGSLAGFYPGPLMSTYYATKSYVVRLTQAISYELKKEKSKVVISVLCPGPVNTHFNDTLGISFGKFTLSSNYVAKYAIMKCLKGRVVIVPGIINKIVRLCNKIIPDIIIMKINYIIQLSKRGNG